jgi:hypothetical protein
MTFDLTQFIPRYITNARLAQATCPELIIQQIHQIIETAKRINNEIEDAIHDSIFLRINLRCYKIKDPQLYKLQCILTKIKKLVKNSDKLCQGDQKTPLELPTTTTLEDERIFTQLLRLQKIIQSFNNSWRILEHALTEAQTKSHDQVHQYRYALQQFTLATRTEASEELTRLLILCDELQNSLYKEIPRIYQQHPIELLQFYSIAKHHFPSSEMVKTIENIKRTMFEHTDVFREFFYPPDTIPTLAHKPNLKIHVPEDRKTEPSADSSRVFPVPSTVARTAAPTVFDQV